MSNLISAIFEADLNSNVNAYRQHLQTSFVEITVSVVDPKNKSYDKVTKAVALHTLKKIKKILSDDNCCNEETKVHRANLHYLIDKALGVKNPSPRKIFVF